MIVRELVTKLGFQLDQAKLSAAERATDNLSNRAESMAAGFRGMFAAFASVQAVKSIITIGDEMQNVQTRIGMLPQTVGDAAAAFDEVAKHATESGASVDAYAKLYTRIGNGAKDYIKTQEELLGITDTISKALVVGGATTAEASSTMLQFAQALGSGVLQGDEFRAMAEAAPQYLDQLSIAMGIPREQLKKMASEGKLTTKAVIEATKKMAWYFDDKFKEMPMTVGRAMQLVKNNWSTMINHLNNESLFITKIAGFIVDAMKGINMGIDWLIEKFDGLGNIVQYSLALIASVIMLKVVPALVMMAITNAAAIAGFLLMVGVVALVAAVLEDLYSWWNGNASALGGFIEYLTSGTASANTFIAVLGALGLAALVAGARMAAGWLLALGPIGLVIAALTAVAALMYKISGNGDIPAVGEFDAMGNATGVGPSDMAGVGGGNNTVNKNTTVNLTVPPGTPQEQAAFLQKAAQESFKAEGGNSMDFSMYAP